MGMCKGCGVVFSALEMEDGYCKDCLPKAQQEQAEKIENINTSTDAYEENMLEAFVGKPEKLFWYKNAFSKFNVNGMPVMKWHWSWWAFFGTWAFLMYRKQYMPAIILLIVQTIATFIGLAWVVMIFAGGYATYFVYKGYRQTTMEIEHNVSDNNKRVETMKQVGGYNGFAIVVKIIVEFLVLFASLYMLGSQVDSAMKDIFGSDYDSYDSNYRDEPIQSNYYDEPVNSDDDADNVLKFGRSYQCDNGAPLKIARDGSYVEIYTSRYSKFPVTPNTYKRKNGSIAVLNMETGKVVFTMSPGVSWTFWCGE